MAEKISWTNETRKLSELIPWPRNPRQIKTDQAKRLAESFEEFSQVELIAIGPDNGVYNGHQRLNVLAAKHGKDYEVEVRVSSRPLTEKEREKLTVFLHKGGAGEWNFDTLANEFELDELLEWGFDKKELDLDLWAGDEPEDPGAQIDKAEELREKWGVELGQLWQLGEHRLICGDALDFSVKSIVAKDGAKLVSADPPYGIKLLGKRGSVGLSKQYEPVIGDENNAVAKALYSAWLPEGELQVWWGANHYGGNIEDSPCWLVWDKDHHGMTFADAELAWTNIDMPVRVFRHAWSGADRDSEKGEKRDHPNQKPVALFEWYLPFATDKGDIVIDPCMGVGGMLIACERLHRKCRAVEISPAYCAVAIQRWVDMTGGTPELIE